MMICKAEVYFAALWPNFLKFQEKKRHPFPCIPIFGNFLTLFSYKTNTIGINTYTLTLNKYPIFMCTYFVTIFNYKEAP